MVKLAKVRCQLQNHRAMHFNYVCTDQQCLEFGKELCCAYCCQELHSNHPEQIKSLKQMAYEIEYSLTQTGELQPAWIILNGLATCHNYADLKTNVREMLALKQQQKLSADKVNHQIEQIHREVKTFYQRDHKVETVPLQKCNIDKIVFLKPMLSFRQSTSLQQITPYTISSKQNKLVSVIAQPSLSTFKQSTQVNIKIERNTPSWLAVGVALTEQQYTQSSDKHLLLFSNGWTNQRGKLSQSKIKYSRGSVIRIRWQKSMQILQFTIKGDKLAFPLPQNWNQRAWICVCMFYNGDRVSLLI